MTMMIIIIIIFKKLELKKKHNKNFPSSVAYKTGKILDKKVRFHEVLFKWFAVQ
jgi:hypothetical protein